MREKTIYEKIAKKYNTTPEEVRREMQIAIDAGFDNPDPAVQEVFMGNLNPVIRKVNRSSRNIFRKSKFNRDG